MVVYNGKKYDLRTKAGFKAYQHAKRLENKENDPLYYAGTFYTRQSALERQKQIDQFNKDTNYRFC
jgi:hypothetical protein